MTIPDDLIRLHNPNHMLAVKERNKKDKKKKKVKPRAGGRGVTGKANNTIPNRICFVCSMSSSTPCIRWSLVFVVSSLHKQYIQHFRGASREAVIDVYWSVLILPLFTPPEVRNIQRVTTPLLPWLGSPVASVASIPTFSSLSLLLFSLASSHSSVGFRNSLLLTSRTSTLWGKPPPRSLLRGMSQRL